MKTMKKYLIPTSKPAAIAMALLYSTTVATLASYCIDFTRSNCANLTINGCYQFSGGGSYAPQSITQQQGRTGYQQASSGYHGAEDIYWDSTSKYYTFTTSNLFTDNNCLVAGPTGVEVTRECEGQYEPLVSSSCPSGS